MSGYAVVLLGPRAPEAMAVALRKAPVKVRPLSAQAADVEFSSKEQAERVAGALRNEGGFDVAVLPAENREKKLLLADMDSTIIEDETLDELAEAFGFGPQVRAITELSMRGELDFDDALRRRVGLLHGRRIDEASNIIRKRTKITEGAVVLIRTMHKRGARTALVTGGFDVFAGPIGEKIGFDDVFANRLRSADGVLTGEVAEPILGPSAKKDRLDDLCEEHHIDHKDVLAVGDGANDKAMLETAGLGVGYRPKPVVEKSADVVLQHADLTALLALQGIPQSEWAAPSAVSL